MPDSSEILLLAHTGDDLAVELGTALRRIARRPVRVISLEELVLSPRVEHAVHGLHAEARFLDHRGHMLELDAAPLVVNRLRHVLIGGGEARGGDVDYVTMERFATLLSALHGLATLVINRPTPSGLSGPSWSPLRWMHAASRAGLATTPLELVSCTRRWPADPAAQAMQCAHYAHAEHPAFGQSGRSHVRWQKPLGGQVELLLTCHDVHVVGRAADAPERVADGCRALGALAGCEQLQISCSVDAEGGWSFVGADPHPTGLPAPSLVRAAQAMVARMHRSLEWAS